MTKNSSEDIKKILSDIIKEQNVLYENKKRQKSFLKLRNLSDPQHSSYGNNFNSLNLIENKDNSDTIQSFVIFSSYPISKKEIGISSDLIQWIKDNKTVDVEGNSVETIVDGKVRYDVDSVTLNNDYNGRINRYTEFHENCFVEQGFLFPLIWRSNKAGVVVLDLCRTTAYFWAYLTFLKKYYSQIKYAQDVEIRLSVHGSNNLNLYGFGGKIKSGGNWVYSPENDHGEPPKTHRDNIEIVKTICPQKTTTKDITNMTSYFSTKLSNAYNLDFSRCYDFDGTFNFDNFH